MGFLGFAVTCFDVLAWPLVSLGYPLYASIRAIEGKSNSDMQKLITYWILFSLISLLELGFSKPIEWLPFWPYIKLMAISYLVLPRFDGAYHVYVCHVRPYCHVNPQVVINKFNELKELSHKEENFLAMADKYVEENGSEALEKLIASKSKGTKPSYDEEEIKEVANTEKKEVDAAIEKDIKAVEQKEKNAAAGAPKGKDPIVVQKDIKAVEQTEKNAAAEFPKGKDPIVVQKDIKAVEQTEKNAAAAAPKSKGIIFGDVPQAVQYIKAVEQTENNAAAAAPKSKGKDPIVVQKDIKAVEQTEKNAAAAAPKSKGIIFGDVPQAVEQTEKNAAAAAPKVKNGEKNLAHAEKKTDATVEINETTATSVAGGGGENKLPEGTTSKNIQKEWACALCQLKCSCEKNLNSHLHGKKHREKWEELKASMRTNKNKGSSSTTANKSDQTNQEPEKRNKQRNPKNAGTQMQQSILWCNICNVRCPGEIDMACHLKGRKHLTRVQEVYGCAGGGQG
ncbi:uncharacterized protein LOC132294219 isoform X5 [Cornus florida]|uniref:uncharacterized protein LOC132294219 isoform X5 n=1 Tax=Cornus florida TaxID=4283 RepID=UPI0028999AAB|nr:uncharacterized protein LOC132294219 isoform X5 [Cornus florida]